MNKMTMLVMFLSLAFVGKTEARGTGTFTTTTPKPDMSIVLITSSRHITSSGNWMEIINPDNSTTICQNDYTYPTNIDVDDASGAVVDGTIVVCGGGTWKGGYPTVTKQCHSFGHDKKWRLGLMTTPRTYAASVPFKGDALWVAGGYGGSNRLNSTELVYLDGRRSSTKQLPEVRLGSCATEYNGIIYLTGGSDGDRSDQDNTWIINANDDFRLTNGPNMLRTRSNHACGIFHSHAHSGRAVIVTAGGFGDETSTGKPIVAAGSGSYGTGPNNCEFWDFTVQGSTWQPCSQDLPTRMFGSRMTPTADGKGLLLSYLNSVYSFVCQSETSCMFAPTEIQLQIERKNHLMLQVPSSLLSEC